MILVDSDVLIANLCGIPAARDWLLAARRDSGPFAVSAVSLTEVAGEMRSAERLAGQPPAVQHAHIPGDGAGRMARCGVHARAPALASGNRARGLPDRGHSGRGRADLATLNVRHFPMIKDLQAPFRV